FFHVTNVEVLFPLHDRPFRERDHGEAKREELRCYAPGRRAARAFDPGVSRAEPGAPSYESGSAPWRAAAASRPPPAGRPARGEACRGACELGGGLDLHRVHDGIERPHAPAYRRER